MKYLTFAVITLFTLASCSGDRTNAPAEPPPRHGMFIAGADAGYLDASVCAGCHAEIYKTYRETGMGRSFYRPRPDRMVEDFTTNNTFYHAPSDRHYSMIERDGKYFQRRHQVGFEGRTTNVVELEINYVMGSGNHARTYLHRTPQGELIELPLAWYAEKGGSWAMNPGYDLPAHQGFRRVISNDCLFCHNGYPELPPGAGAPGADALFPGKLPEGVDCQRCHGPGRDHVEAATAQAAPEEIRNKIFNPSTLDPARQLELCLQCHLESTSRALPYSLVRFSRTSFSYRPWEPLGDYIVHFDYAPGQGPKDHFEIAHAAYRFRKSRCFTESAGRLLCTTCHNPHQAKRGVEAVAHYTAVCLTCHAEPHTESRDCLTCHMPKRRTDDVVHVVMTDHFIRRRQPRHDLLAPIKETHDTGGAAYHGEVVVSYPPELPDTPENELLAATAQVFAGANLEAGIPQLRAAIEKYQPEEAEYYHQLAEAYWKDGQSETAAHWYRRALDRDSAHLRAIRNLGATLISLGRYAEAAAILRKAPDDAGALGNLGEAYLQQGRADAAVTAFRRSIEANPNLPEVWNGLGQALASQGLAAESIDALREAIRLQPDLGIAHNNLANRLNEAGDPKQAEYHFRQAIRSSPRHAVTRYNYGALLAGQQRFAEAEEQMRAAIRLDPQLAEAHLNLGNIVAMRGHPDQAIGHFRRALAIRPDLPAARLNLGLALAQTGRIEEALAEFRRAAKSSDPDVRQNALTAVEKLGGAVTP